MSTSGDVDNDNHEYYPVLDGDHNDDGRVHGSTELCRVAGADGYSRCRELPGGVSGALPKAGCDGEEVVGRWVCEDCVEGFVMVWMG